MTISLAFDFAWNCKRRSVIREANATSSLLSIYLRNALAFRS
jgi:hypothetical protein